VIFARRERTGKDPHLVWKIRLFFLAAVLALGGMVADLVWLIWCAVAALMAGMGLKFLPGTKKDL
jgi:hypothetical protein